MGTERREMSSLSTGQGGTLLNGRAVGGPPDPEEWGACAPRVEAMVRGRMALVVWEGPGGARVATHGVIDAVKGGQSATVVLSPVLATYEGGRAGQPLRRCTEIPLEASFTLSGGDIAGSASIHIGSRKIGAALKALGLD